MIIAIVLMVATLLVIKHGCQEARRVFAEMAEANKVLYQK